MCSDYMTFRIIGQILKKKADVSSQCRVLYRLRKRNMHEFFLSETFISFSITILLKFAEIWESEYFSYCFLKKITNRRLFQTFRSKGSVVNSVNLFRISIPSSTSFLDGGGMGLSGTSSSSLLPISNGLNRLWKVFVNSFVNKQWSKFVGRYLYQNQRAHLHLGFQELSLV